MPDIPEPAVGAALLALGAAITKMAEAIHSKITGSKGDGRPIATLTASQTRQLDEIHAGVSRLDVNLQDVPNQLYRTSLTLDLLRETMAKQVEILSALQVVSQMSAETLKSLAQEIRVRR